MGTESSGITRRDFFAAHAPAEIPDWFEAEYLGERPTPPAEGHLTETERANVTFAVADQGHRGADVMTNDDYSALGERRAAFAAAVDRRAEYYEARDRYDLERKAHRFFAWRMFYANRMCEAAK